MAPNGNSYPVLLTQYLESCNQSEPPTFMELLERLYALRYTGPVVLHFAGGLPRQVILDQPVRVPLDTKA